MTRKINIAPRRFFLTQHARYKKRMLFTRLPVFFRISKTIIFEGILSIIFRPNKPSIIQLIL
jgi:hypothetical protein